MKPKKKKMKQEVEILKLVRENSVAWHEKLGRKRVKMKHIDENSTHVLVKLKTLQHKYQGFSASFSVKISAK